MQEPNFDERIRELIAKDPRYARDAYIFLREALDFTQKTVGRGVQTKSSHVSVHELLDGIRQFALAQFGPMTRTVLEEWGVKSCTDFGELVFNMIDVGLLAKTENDSRESFQQGYDFTEAFCKPYWPQCKQEAATKKSAVR
jgi:uncharacterized repeat protein (TIGR04138 family)